jgi:hypothetical protein
MTRLKIPAQMNASSYSLASNRDMNFFKVYATKSAKDDRLAGASGENCAIGCENSLKIFKY